MRRVAVFVLALGVLIGGAVPAAAQELTDYIDKQAGATYSGDQTVVCVTPEGNVTQVASVSQTAGVRVTEIEDGSLVVSQVGASEPQALAPRYEVTAPRPGSFLGRSVVRYNVLDEGTLRMALTFDDATGALLESETFNLDGSIYCRSRLVTFRDAVTGSELTSEFMVEPQGSPLDEVTAEIEERVPEQIAAFQRVAIFEWPDRDVVTGHYSDGLFSMTLFVSDRAIEVPELEDKEPVELEFGVYQRAFSVGTVVYAWRADSGGYVLIGDLTLDMQDEVLAVLPPPERLGFFGRLWRTIFR